jgi:CubicO group peptidase (beta-lactamase class C family)
MQMQQSSRAYLLITSLSKLQATAPAAMKSDLASCAQALIGEHWMKNFPWTVLSAALFCAVSGMCLLSSANAETSTDSAVKSTVDQAARQFFMQNPQAAGVSIGVYKDGKTYTYNYGTVERGKHRAPTADTLYPIASITKTFTGTLLAQAALEGKVRLDDDVRKYLEGDYPNLEFEGHPIRLFDLLDHRSGLPFFIPDRPETRPDFENNLIPWPIRIANIEKTYTRQDFFDDLHKVKLTAVPGDKFQYSNAAAMLTGYILERIYGTSYATLLKEKVLAPLKMDATTILLTPSQARKAAKGYDEKGNLAPENPNELQAAGAIRSSVNDMLKYAEWQMEETDAAVKLSHNPVFTSGFYSAGLNWQEMSSDGLRVIWQEGNIVGFNSFCIVEPELKIGLVLLANEEDQTSAHGQSVLANEILKGLDAKSVLMP